MEIKKIILEKLQKIVQNLTQESFHVLLTTPKEQDHGDYTTNIALQLAKKLQKNPLDIAKEIAERLQESENEILEQVQGNKTLLRRGNLVKKIEVVQPGFINFYLSETYLQQYLQSILKNPEDVAKGNALEDRKIIVEFTDPNPFKQLHIGHVYSNVIGEALCKLFESQGAEVKRVTYQGDVGLHVAKALWGMQQLSNDMPQNNASLDEKSAYLGQAYALGAAKYEENESAKQEIKELNKRIYIKDPSLMDLYRKGKEWSLAYFDSMYAQLGMHFDMNFFESMVGEAGLQVVKEHITDGIFTEDNGAIIFQGEKYGLHNRVFINSQDLPTYEAKDLALPRLKYQKFPYDFSLIITGHEQDGYFTVMLRALKEIEPDLAEKTKHLSHGMVRLPEGKMSSRTGNVITAGEVLKRAKDLAKEKIAQAKFSHNSVDEEEREKIAEKVGIGAIKYSFLKSSIGRDIPFSFEESISFEGNAGPYLQYTYTRTQSVLEKSEKDYHDDLIYNPNNEETALSRKIYQFNDIVAEAAATYAPHIIAEYLFNLAQAFNLFYQKYRILKADTGGEKAFRLTLTKGVGIVLKEGLRLLGIAAPDHM